MADETPAPDPVAEPTSDAAPIELTDPATPEPPAVDAPAAVRAAGPLRRASRFVGRWTRRGGLFVIAALAAGFVSIFTIDFGPLFKDMVEREGSKFLERPLHIGRLSATLRPGVFVLDDVVIDGKKPGDRPFMTIGRIYAYVPWWSLSRKQLLVELTLTDWRMLVERWSDGHNVPKLAFKGGSGGPKLFTTTVTAYAKRGEFTYEDHATPWSIVARNLNFALVRAENLKQYVGRADFSEGTLKLLDYRPMRADMTTRFVLDGSKVQLKHIDLLTDGTESHISGNLDFKEWPAQIYHVNSRVDFATMRDIFFSKEKWRLSGEGKFTGQFALAKDNRRLLAGEFSSELAGVNALVFPHLHGALEWANDRFVVRHAESDFLGGEMRLTYGLAPLGTPRPATATFTADYAQLDASGLGQVVNLSGLELAGIMDGSVRMQWPNGRFTQMRGDGHTRILPPDGVTVASPILPAEPRAARPEPSPFNGATKLGRLAVGADVHYTFDPDGVSFEPSTAATEWTFVSFEGRTASRGQSDFPFNVTSHDWQESDRVLVAIMSAISGETGAVEMAGRGTFQGRMTGTFSAPRIEGRFSGERTRVWGVTWGRAIGDVVIQDKYVTIANSRIGDRPDQVIVADGRYALGFRADGAEEIKASVSLQNWPVADLRHAFNLDDWPMDGTIGEARLDLTGRYKDMFGTGRVRIDKGVAWKEPFDVATGDLVLEGSGMRINRMEITKGSGLVRGAARVGWRDGTYAFNADGERIPVESLANFQLERTPLSGLLTFRATGSGPFESPSYDVDASVADLFISSEGIGQVSGHLRVKDDVLTFERMTAASNRLQMFGSGSIALNDASDADLLFRFQETSIDPYLRLLAPEFPTYARAVLSGSLQVRGPLADWTHLLADVTIDESVLTLFAYKLANDGPARLTFEDNVIKVGRLRLKGQDTALEVSGSVDATKRAYDLTATGDASLAILEVFFPSLTASGAASLSARLTGPFDKQQIEGQATLTDGRLRHFSLNHSLDDINGPVKFDVSGINVDDLRATMGGGPITFGGSIALDRLKVTQFDLRATGNGMRLRYPVSFNSTVNADLTLTGSVEAMRLGGRVDVLRTRYIGTFESDLIALAVGGVLGSEEELPAPVAPEQESGIPLSLDVDIHMPVLAVVENSIATINATGDLRIAGSLDQPIVSGRLDVENGVLNMSGNRYFIRPGSIDFPGSTVAQLLRSAVFDLQVETLPRATGQTFTITIRVSGTADSLTPNITSDPWLSETDVLALLVGVSPDLSAIEQRRLSPQDAQMRLVQTLAAQLVASPLTSRVGNVMAQAFPGIDTVQITPVLMNDVAFQRLDPTARITFGKQVSERVYLTYSRSLSGAENELALLEDDQNDRVSWVLSRNEDGSFALDFRIRFVF